MMTLDLLASCLFACFFRSFGMLLSFIIGMNLKVVSGQSEYKPLCGSLIIGWRGEMETNGRSPHSFATVTKRSLDTRISQAFKPKYVTPLIRLPSLH